MARVAGFAFLVLALVAPAGAQEPPGYYDAAQDLQGDALKTALHNIIDDHDARSYSALRDALPEIDAADRSATTTGGNRQVRLIYRRDSVAASTWPRYNREHLWPQSRGTRRVPAKSDAHHVFASDTDVNGRRGSLEFGDCESPCTPDPEAPLALNGVVLWEPPDEVKGDIARAMLYMVVRYEGEEEGEQHGEPDLELRDFGASEGCNCMSRQDDLLRWHRIDPVSAEEQARHEAVFDFQGNRNPFIDHPEWVWRIWRDPDGVEGGGTGGVGPTEGPADGPTEGPTEEPVSPVEDPEPDEPGGGASPAAGTGGACSDCIASLELFAELAASNPLGVPLHSEPRSTDDFARVADGTVVQVVGSAFDGGWLRVRLEDGREGWISRRYVGRFVE